MELIKNIWLSWQKSKNDNKLYTYGAIHSKKDSWGGSESAADTMTWLKTLMGKKKVLGYIDVMQHLWY